MTRISSIALIIALVIPPLAAVGSSAYAQAVATDVPAGIQFSKDLGLVDPSAEINITVHLKLSDKAAFDQAVEALYDPASPSFHQWMTNEDLKKFAPSETQQLSVRQELAAHGLTILSTDKIGFTIRAHGTIANVESAFNTEIHQFEHNGKTFRANVRDIRLTARPGIMFPAWLVSKATRCGRWRFAAVNPRTEQTNSIGGDRQARTKFRVSRRGAPRTVYLRRQPTTTGKGSNASAVYSGTVYSA